MKIDSVTAYVFQIPLKTPFRISAGEIRVKDGILFACRSGDYVGWGEAAVDEVPFYAHETVGSVLDIARKVLAPQLQSRDFAGAQELVALFDTHRGNRFAKTALEAAFWDLLGKTRGTPVARLLGGVLRTVVGGEPVALRITEVEAYHGKGTGDGDVALRSFSAFAGLATVPVAHALARELGFSRVAPNSLDAVSDRDFIIEFVSASALLMVHLSRLCEELILWTSREFGFCRLDDAFTTGSSMMPQKRNPDLAELIRGKSGRVTGSLVSLLMMVKGLPLAYNKDMQEDKEPLFDAADTARGCLKVMAAMIQTARFNRDRLAAATRGDFSTATDLADYLVRKGLPFRDAHDVSRRIVMACLEQGRALEDLSLDELRAYSPLFAEDALLEVSPERSAARRTSEGGTAPERVREQIALARELLGGV